MGTRYIISVTCPVCKFVDDDCWYAPTCGVDTWICPKCKCIVNLEDYTGISKEETSNKLGIEELIKEIHKDV